MNPNPNHPAGSKLHYCRLCASGRRKQPLLPGGVDKQILACPACDPTLFLTLKRKEPT